MAGLVVTERWVKGNVSQCHLKTGIFVLSLVGTYFDSTKFVRPNIEVNLFRQISNYIFLAQSVKPSF